VSAFKIVVRGPWRVREDIWRRSAWAFWK